jgi:DNA-binding NtrC family response regulator
MSQNPLRVLLVDELADERVMYGMGLRLLGFELSDAANADHALRAAATFRPHVIVLHLGVGGWDLCDVFGRCGATSQAPVIVITADVRPDRINRSRALTTQNCAAFLGKPCTHEDVAAVIRRVAAGERRIELATGPSNYPQHP